MIRRDSMEVVRQLIQETGAPFGAFDLVLTSRGSHDEIVLAHVAHLLFAGTDTDPYFARVRVVLPSGIPQTLGETLRACVHPDCVDRVLARFDLVVTADRSAESLVQAAMGLPERSAIVCGNLELYAADRVENWSPDSEQEGLTREQVRMFQSERVAAQALADLAAVFRPHLCRLPNPYVVCVAGCGSLGEFSERTHQGFDRVAILGAPPVTVSITMQDINSWAAQLRSGTPISAISNQIAGAGG